MVSWFFMLDAAKEDSQLSYSNAAFIQKINCTDPKSTKFNIVFKSAPAILNYFKLFVFLLFYVNHWKNLSYNSDQFDKKIRLPQHPNSLSP